MTTATAGLLTRILALVPQRVDVRVKQERQHVEILPFAVTLTTRTPQHLDTYLYSNFSAGT